MRWWRRIADELDLHVADESELRGVLKGMTLGLLIYCGLLIGVAYAYTRAHGG